MPEGGSAECVKVAIRCRPPSKKEIANNEESIVELTEAFSDPTEPGEVVLNDPTGTDEPGKFAFDIVFGLSIEQSQVYDTIGRPAMLKTFEGYNGTIFAYGQTGSGKSWSMSGAPEPTELRGIIPRMNEALFSKIAEEQVGTKRFLVMCSYFEIYNEIIFDLLNPVSDRGKLGGGLQIKEHPVMGIYVKDLTEIVAESSQKLEDLLDSGMKNRAVSSTMMNSVSSRSHSIFTIKVHQKDDDDASKSVFAKLNLVDLAGSERQKGTGATGQTLKEGANINKSLSALGNVINALVECANGKKVFIPYRNSKLTRVLQESLGGNSLCTMLATLSPAACNYEETMSTLRYANRAKAIKVSATKNEEASQISRLKAEVEELKKKLSAGGGGAATLTEAEREAEREKFEKQLKEMEKMMSDNWGAKAQFSDEHERKMKKLAEERKLDALAVEEERNRRLRLLQEKNDLELSVRALSDFVLHLPRMNGTPSVLSGELPRQWLKTYRSLRQQLESMKEHHRMLVMVFKPAFDEDVRLWGEGLETDDLGLASTGLNRSMLKLEKLRKAGDKLFQLESQTLGSSSEMLAAVQASHQELEKFRQTIGDEVGGGGSQSGIAKLSSVDEVARMLALIEKQAQEKMDELKQYSTIDMTSTCEILLLLSQEPCREEAKALQAIVADPSLASMPPGMPAKPLREYAPEEVSDTPETTVVVLAQLIRWEGLCARTRKSAPELLARPPPKFILDVACAVQTATGFPPGLGSDWPEAREEKLARLQSIVDAVSVELGTVIDFFDPQDVLKGKEVAKTLRLMQLLAVAAASHMPSKCSTPSETNATRARDLPAMLNAMGRCLKAANAHIDASRNAANEGENETGTLQEQVSRLERELEEAKAARRRSEEELAEIEKVLEESMAEVRQVQAECRMAMESAENENGDPEIIELERQIAELSHGGVSFDDMSEDEILAAIAEQIDQARSQLERDEQDVKALERRQAELQQSVDEAEASCRRLDAELERERERREAEQELIGQSPEEQKLILESHQETLRTRASALEEQISAIQTEAEERKQNNLILESEGKALSAKIEDVALQMQIVVEERDAMREAMENLWNDKAPVDEQLNAILEGYTNLSERLNQTLDEKFELQALLECKQQKAASFQKNFDTGLPVSALA